MRTARILIRLGGCPIFSQSWLGTKSNCRNLAIIELGWVYPSLGLIKKMCALGNKSEHFRYGRYTLSFFLTKMPFKMHTIIFPENLKTNPRFNKCI